MTVAPSLRLEIGAQRRHYINKPGLAGFMLQFSPEALSSQQ